MLRANLALYAASYSHSLNERTVSYNLTGYVYHRDPLMSSCSLAQEQREGDTSPAEPVLAAPLRLNSLYVWTVSNDL